MTLAERLTASLSANPSPGVVLLPGDDRPSSLSATGLVPAAVLIAITDQPEPGVILTQRADTLRRHAGQIAFPGGRIDPEDRDAIHAALREAEEEIALPSTAVQVIGTTDRYRTGTGYDITPVIGIVPSDLSLRPSEAEVADVFEVPLRHLLDPQNHRPASAMWQGRERRFHEIAWRGRRIWGATAGIIVNLSRRLAWR